MKQPKSFQRKIAFDEVRKAKLLALRDRLDYLSNGAQALIASRVKCTRQTVHNVLYDYDDEITAKSDYAYFVWKELEAVVNTPEAKEEYETMKKIVDGLRTGRTVKLEMPLPQFRQIKRKLDHLKVLYTLDKIKGWPNTYVLKGTPKTNDTKNGTGSS